MLDTCRHRADEKLPMPKGLKGKGTLRAIATMAIAYARQPS
ncbi:MAG TPA: hypothetical protein V6C85_05670 [Allocoleopsis sp.]